MMGNILVNMMGNILVNVTFLHVCVLLIPYSWYCTQGEAFYSKIILPSTTQHAQVLPSGMQYFYQTLTKFGFSQQIFIEASSVKFHGNLFSEICTDTRGQTWQT